MIVLFFCPPLINILFVVLAAAEYHKSEDGKSKEVKVRPNFQDFRWESTYDGDRCKESAYDLYQKSFHNITKFFQTAVCKLPKMKYLVHSKDKGKVGLLADMLAIQPIVACKGYLYFGVKTPSEFESDIDISPLNLLFDDGAAKFAFGVLKMDTGMVYSTGMRVSLRRHRQVPRGVVAEDQPKQEEVTWKVLGVLYSHVPGGKRSGFEPILICCNAKISRYDYQYKEDTMPSRPGDETADWKHKNKNRRNCGNHPFIPTYEGFPKFRRNFFWCFQSAVSSPGLDV